MATSTTMRPELVSQGMAIMGTPLGYLTLCFPRMTEGMEMELLSPGKSFLALPAIMFAISPRASVTSELISENIFWQRAEAR